MKFRLINFTLSNNDYHEKFQDSLKLIEQMLEQNVDCTVVEEGTKKLV